VFVKQGDNVLDACNAARGARPDAEFIEAAFQTEDGLRIYIPC
jgi:hypothetical protein